MYSKPDLSYCDTCKSPIEFLPYRILTMKDMEGFPKTLRFHYFYPCWDFDLVCQKYPNYEIVHAGFSCDLETITPKILKNLRKNEFLWE